MSRLPKHRPPTHPGEFILEDFITPLDITQKQLAQHLGWTEAKLSELIQGKRRVTVEIALSLEDALGMSAGFWLNAQQAYDLWHARQKHKALPRLEITFGHEPTPPGDTLEGWTSA